MEKGKTLIVVGAGELPCSEIAVQQARQGALVILVDDEKEKLDSVQRRIQEIGGQAFVYACNLSDPSETVRVAVEIKAAFGCCDYLISGKGAAKEFLANTTVTMHTEGAYTISCIETKEQTDESVGGYEKKAVQRLPQLHLCM